MAQLNFAMNFHLFVSERISINQASLSFVPFMVQDSISFNTMNFHGASSGSITLSIGLYSLSGLTLSLENSISGSTTRSAVAQAGYISLANTSKTQNITPGTWYFGILASMSNNTSLSFLGQSFINPSNAFPGGFIGGAMTDSTNALPSSIATSDLDITGQDALSIPSIILSA